MLHCDANSYSHSCVYVCAFFFLFLSCGMYCPLDYHQMRMTYFHYCVILFFVITHWIFPFRCFFSVILFFPRSLLFIVAIVLVYVGFFSVFPIFLCSLLLIIINKDYPSTLSPSFIIIHKIR
jgi:hypothetical protein